MTTTGLPAALQSCAHGIYALEAATGLIIAHASWLDRDDYTRFIRTGPGTAAMASIDWPAAITALNIGELPCSGGENRMLQLAASLAGQAPVILVTPSRDSTTATSGSSSKPFSTLPASASYRHPHDRPEVQRMVQDRMGITGARWGLAGAQAILWLRAICASGDTDAYWAWHIQQEHQRNHLSRYQDSLGLAA
jgi:hypothetical protein